MGVNTAHELVKAHSAFSGKTVEKTKGKEGGVTVDGVLAFTQSDTSGSGYFQGLWSTLSLVIFIIGFLHLLSPVTLVDFITGRLCLCSTLYFVDLK